MLASPCRPVVKVTIPKGFASTRSWAASTRVPRFSQAAIRAGAAGPEGARRRSCPRGPRDYGGCSSRRPTGHREDVSCSTCCSRWPTRSATSRRRSASMPAAAKLDLSPYQLVTVRVAGAGRGRQPRRGPEDRPGHLQPVRARATAGHRRDEPLPVDRQRRPRRLRVLVALQHRAAKQRVCRRRRSPHRVTSP